MTNLSSYFEHYGLPGEAIEPGVWHSTFAGPQAEEFDLYVLVAEDWVHFAVSPLAPRRPPAATDLLYATLLRMNQEVRLVRLAVDADGDVNLLADLPLAHINFATFAQALDLLVYYAGQLASDLRLVAPTPDFQSPLFD